MIPPMMDREPIAPQKGLSDLEIAKQLFDEEMKKMRVKKPKRARGNRKVEGASRNE